VISLRLDDTAVLEGLSVLGDQAPVAASRAINRTVTNVVTAMARAVAQSLGLPVGEVKKRIFTTQANRARLTARIVADNKPIPVILFNARGPEPSRGKGNGVTARTQTGRYPHAFIATMPRSGHRGVFQRVNGKFMRSNSKRQAIRELRESSVAAVWIHHEAAGQARGNEQLQKNLQHEVDYLLTKQVQKVMRAAARA
jgi:hypothetical protein